MARGKILQTIIDISGELSPSLGRAIDDVTGRLEGVNLKALAVAGAMGGIAIGTGKAVVKAAGHLAELGDEYNRAVNDIAASTGLAGDELAGMGDVLKDVYANNFGENFEEIAAGMADLYKNTGLTGEALQSVTEGAFILSDTFGYEVTESARAAKAMMNSFGVDGEEAMELIAAGAQNGLDFSGELIDSINEYSVQFAKIGMSADDMFSIFQAGADSGAWNLDKVGDAVKEFSIRSIDGSKTSADAYAAIGVNAEEAMAIFSQGGEDAQFAFRQVINALMDMEDPIARDAAGVGLFGTQWEDLGVEAMQALADVEGGVYGTGEALDGINQVKYDNIGAALEGIKRQAEVSLLPLASTIARSFAQIGPVVGELFEELGPVIEDVTSTMMPFVQTFLDGALTGMRGLIPLVSKLAGSLLPLLSTLVGNLLPPLLALAEGLLPPLMEIMNAVLPTIAGLLLAILPTLTQLGAAVLPVIAELAAAFLPLLQPVLEVLTSMLNDVILPLLPPILDLATALLPPILAVVQGLLPLFGPLVDSLKPMADVLGEIVGFIGKVVGWAAQGLTWVVDLVMGKGEGALPAFAAGGFTKGPSLAGEAGTEAVLSFDPAYRAENLSYWAQAGRMLGAGDAGFSLGSGGGGSVDLGGVVFAPEITVQGGADQQDIVEAIRAASLEFMDLLEELMAERAEGCYVR